MKAIHRFLIVALLFVGATGFGLTTTDLNQNSDPEFVVCDYADILSDYVVDLNAEQSYLVVAKANKSVLKSIDKSVEDSKVRNLSVDFRNSKDFYRKINNRNPRDGLTYDSE